ncbi:hypothetical protein [Microbacterium sp. NPDC077184]|uniref:hypothetical protein n=1 Tax=Microbacterium sp. NPDC077184 TaxID=3154764 RepID=UPI00341A1D37
MPGGPAGAGRVTAEAQEGRSLAAETLGPIAEIGAFQRTRMRRAAAGVGGVATVCILFIADSIVRDGVSVTFSADTPVRPFFLFLIAMVFVMPIVWSAVLRSRRYGVTLTEEAVVVESWWRTRRYERGAVRSAMSGPAQMRFRDGFFSGQGTVAAPAAIWLFPSDHARPFPLGVTTGSFEAVEAACGRINEWIEAGTLDGSA